ncbi:MAG: class I fructose-bisphosphate aldolase [Acidobacteriota bacterium]
MALNSLEEVAQAIVVKGKGILAADESTGTIKKRFDTIGAESSEDSRRSYRELLVTTPGAEEFISGVILFDETARQKGSDGTPLVEALSNKGIIPGIKVDKGAKALAEAPGEKVTEGLDGLRERLQEYRSMGLRFAKWRAVITIGDGIPSHYCIQANAHALARYAALCVEQDLVPIVEPEVMMEGPHSIEACCRATALSLQRTFSALLDQRVPLEKILLKPNMVLSGKECPVQAGVQEVAEETVRCFRRVVPAAVPGVVFLSGGQSDVEATAHLNAMNQMHGHPWHLSFSYGRALQAAALQAWQGKPENGPQTQQALYKRARFNGLATRGEYSAEMEQAVA